MPLTILVQIEGLTIFELKYEIFILAGEFYPETYVNARSWKNIPLCSKFLNSSKLAQPGLNTILSPAIIRE